MEPESLRCLCAELDTTLTRRVKGGRTGFEAPKEVCTVEVYLARAVKEGVAYEGEKQGPVAVRGLGEVLASPSQQRTEPWRGCADVVVARGPDNVLPNLQSEHSRFVR